MIRAMAAALALTVLSATAAGQDPPKSLVYRALSGAWSYESTFSTNQISGCPGLGAAGRSTKGPATLTAATDGTSMRLQLGSQELQFVRPGLDPWFRTFPRPFPAKDGKDNTVMGSVEFEARVEAPDQITGKTKWDNGVGCKAEYRFALKLVAPAEPPAVVPRPGHWTIVPAPAVCASGSVTTPALGGLGTLTLDPVNALTVTVSSSSFHVTRTGPLAWKGPAVVPAMVGGMPAMLTGEIFLTFVEPTKAIGTIVGSSGPCTAGVQLTLTYTAG